ncbi:hypothetical protein [Helicobacter bilis]|uniref:hypothetical protein n=1 Tax=Helicobacter bilis TaxID=37372 RepID=UPI001315A8CF|nr:hypothetical protein [Helicobacter bilis]
MSPLVISKALPPCHTERSEVSKNAESTTESKRDFSPFQRLKMTIKRLWFVILTLSVAKGKCLNTRIYNGI